MIRSIIAGLLLAAAAPPQDHWYLAVVALAVLFAVLRSDRNWHKRLLHAFAAYGVMFAFTLAWTQQFTLPGRVALSAAEALMLAAPLVLLPRTRRAHGAVAFVALVTLAELLRTHVPWGGLPLGGFTGGMLDAPWVRSVAVVGETGLVAMTALLAVAVVALRSHLKTVAVPAVAIVVAITFVGAIDHTEPRGTLDVATVQAGGPQGLQRAEQRPDRVFAGHVATTDQVVGADFIAWPENVVTVDQSVESTEQGRLLAEIARAKRAYLGAGVVERNRQDRTFRNAYVVWSPDGEVVSRYEKRRRVPFGEYVPMRAFFDSIADLSQVPSDAVPGKGEATVLTGAGEAAVAISYEGMFSRLVASGVGSGGNIVIIPTNAASYENPDVAKSQVRGARLRALETGRSVVQAAPTGISVIVDSNSRVLQMSSVGEARVLSSSLVLETGTTPYVRFGDVPLLVICLLGLAWAAWRERSARRAGAANED